MNISSVVKQVFGKMKLMGGSDGTVIGNVGDALKISGTFTATTNEGIVDTGNSSTSPLLANATFTGAAIEIKNYSAINVAAYSDVSSATDGLKMQFSPDGTNWDHQHTFSVTGNVGVSYAQAAELRYFRIVYVNGASNQTFFRLTVILKPTDVSPSRFTVGQQLQSGMMSEVTKSVIWGLSSTGGGTYVAAKVTPSGSLTTAIGDITGVVGQNTMANSLPVTIASNQTAFPVSQSGTWNITNISGTVSLPTGASTEAKQDSQITELQAIKGHVDLVETKLDTLITQTDAIESSLSSIDTKVATAAKQDTGNSSLSSIDTKVATAANQASEIAELQAIKGHVDSVETKLDTLITQTDGVEGTLTSIDTKVATAAKQDTGNTSLSSIDTKVATSAKQDSQITELQAIKGHVDLVETKLDTLITQTDGVEGSLSSIDTKVATAANQTTANASLSSIDGKTPTLGQKTMTGSQPVVIASDQSNVPVLVQDNWKATYTAGATNYVPYTLATDILTIAGSATKVIRIYKIHISAIATNNLNTHYDCYLIRRSSANTGGTPTVITGVVHDTLNPAHTATITRYATAPTLGTAVGTMNQSDLFASTNTKAGDTPVLPWNVLQMNFGMQPELQPLVLRGTNEVIAINLNGITVSANLEIDIEWTESDT